MAVHDIKGKELQIKSIISREEATILINNVLRYAGEFTLDDLDLVYKKYLDTVIADLSGSNTFIGNYATFAELNATLPAEIPEGAYAFVGSGETFAVYFRDATAATWVAGGGGGGGTMTAEQIRDSLQTLVDEGRLDASAIKNLPGVNTADHIIEPGELVIDTPTAATLTGASWFFGGAAYTFTGPLTLSAAPVDPNNQFVIVTVGPSATPLVENGTAAPEPVIPTPATAGHLILQTIYRPFDGADVVIPKDPKNPSTASKPGLYELFAPIWSQTLQKNTYYGFKISFISWASAYNIDGQFPTNGFIAVDFVTGASSKEIDPARVSVRTVDISVRNGEFVLVQTSADQATLYAKKRSFLGNMTFNYMEPILKTVSASSLINNGSYAALPVGAAYPSYNGRDYVPSTGVVRFDLPRSYGYGGTPVTGNIAFASNIGDTAPTNPDRADSDVMAKVLHNSSTAPTVTQPAGVTLRREAGDYVTDVDNQFLFIIHKNDAGAVTRISYTITQNQV